MTRSESSPVPISTADQALVGGDAESGVIWLRGEHDMSTVSALAATLSRAVAARDGDVVVDLREVEFMDASTIGVIVGARNLLARQSRALTVRSPSACAQRIFDACGLTDLIESIPAATGATSAMGAAGALGTWVAVAATERAQTRDDAAGGTSRNGDDPLVPPPAAAVHRADGETDVTVRSGVR